MSHRFSDHALEVAALALAALLSITGCSETTNEERVEDQVHSGPGSTAPGGESAGGEETGDEAPGGEPGESPGDEPAESEGAGTEERVPRMQLMRMFQAASEFCRGVTDTPDRACLSEAACRGYCDRMLTTSHTEFMMFPCGGQHTERCYNASRPASGSAAFSAAEAAEVEDPAGDCWLVASNSAGGSVLACGNVALKLAWVSG